MKEKTLTGLVFILGFCGLVVYTLLYAHKDLWLDEIVSLQLFALRDFSTTVTYYPAPNNHILYNLYNNLVCRLLQINTLVESQDKEHWLRLFQLPLAVGSLFFTYRYAALRFGKQQGLLAFIFLLTTVPFLNFAFQLRGYGMSVFWLSALLYASEKYRNSPKAVTLFLFGLSAFSLLYTLPSNVYVLTALGTILLADFLSDPRDVTRRNLLIALAVGAVIAFLVYYPLLNQIENHVVLDRKPPFRFYTLTDVMPRLIFHFTSARYLVLIVALVGFFLFLFPLGKKTKSGTFGKWGKLLLLFFLPFIFSFLRNDYPFQRTFIALTPVFAVLLAIPFYKVIRRFKYSNITLLLTLIYGTGNYVWQHHYIQQKLNYSLSNNYLEQNLYYNFYQADTYQPQQFVEAIAEDLLSQNHPVILSQCYDRGSIPHYLMKYNIGTYNIRAYPFTPLKQSRAKEAKYTHWCNFVCSDPGTPDFLDNIKTQINLAEHPEETQLFSPTLELVERIEPSDHYYVITAYEDKFTKLMKKYYGDKYRFKKLSSSNFSNKLFLISKIKEEH